MMRIPTPEQTRPADWDRPVAAPPAPSHLEIQRRQVSALGDMALIRPICAVALNVDLRAFKSDEDKVQDHLRKAHFVDGERCYDPAKWPRIPEQDRLEATNEAVHKVVADAVENVEQWWPGGRQAMVDRVAREAREQDAHDRAWNSANLRRAPAPRQIPTVEDVDLLVTPVPVDALLDWLRSTGRCPDAPHRDVRPTDGSVEVRGGLLRWGM